MGPEGAPRFFNRELSWLAFNGRVLEEAQDPAHRPLERLKFLVIVSSNLDEFFAVRVAAIRHLRAVAPGARDNAGLTPAEQLQAVRRDVLRMIEDQHRCLAEEVWPSIEAHGARRLTADRLSQEQMEYLQGLFDQELSPALTPIAVDGRRRFPALADKEISLAVDLRGPDGRPRVALVAVPRAMPRLVYLPAARGMEFILLEDVVRAFLPGLFQGCAIRSSLLFRTTRDADLSVEEEKDEDFAEAMSEVLRRRRHSSIVRLEVEKKPPPRPLAFLAKRLSVQPEDIYEIPGPLDLKGYLELAGVPALADLREPEWRPQPSPDLPQEADLWQVLRSRDVLLHHPYESFDPVVRLVAEAAEDPNVLAIKQILYRCGGDSRIVRALEAAAENGKHVTVVVELMARFDEGRNIEWARRLERAGAYVIYGVAGLKTHGKACMVVRREPERIVRYIHLGTGNYNETTARLYTDLGLLTCDEALASDVGAFFNTITGYSQPMAWHRIEMAPTGLKQRLLRLIRREADRSTPETPGLILAKMNSLVHPEIIDALYAASRAGVRVRLNVRGTCCLRPGVRGLSDHIEVISILDRFLEHSRIFYFYNGGDEEVFLSSADWMPRNLDRRIELMFPVVHPPMKARLIAILKAFFDDNVKGRWLRPDGTYVRPEPARRRFCCQDFFMDEARERAQRAVEASRREFRPRKPVR